MGATTIGGAGAAASRLAGYADAVSAVFRRRKPAWAVATFDMAAVFLAVGAVHAINGMIFAVPPSAEVSAVQETKGDQLVLSAGAEGKPGLSPALARLAADARVALAAPDDLIVFAEAHAFVGRFGSVVNAPGEGGFASAGGTPRTGGTAAPPPTAEPTGPEPTLLAYLPLPQPAADVAAEAIATPPFDRVAEVAERATGAPLDLTAALGLDIDTAGSLSATSAVVSAGATVGIGAGGGATVGAATDPTTGTAASVSASLGETVRAGVGSVTGLLR
jgi:hypothetical protein